MVMKGLIFVLMFTGFLVIFYRMRRLRALERFLRQTRENMAENARQRLLTDRRSLLALQKSHSLWSRMEKELRYSGWKRRFPFLTAETWIAGNLAAAAGIFVLAALPWGMGWALAAVLTALSGEVLFLQVCKARENASVNNNLLKLLDFLGSYSITAGELSGILSQVGRYVEEPLKSALNECCYEAQTTGDVSLSLLAMADKIEHPQFKELVRNMEISIRYSADLLSLVSGSRRSVREYLRTRVERRGILQEAVMNMVLLSGMSLLVLLLVDRLIDASVWGIIFSTMPGRLALGIMLVIVLLFLGQLWGNSK